MAFFPFILAVDANIPVKTPQELVTWARANKGKVFYAYGTPTVQIPAEAINRIEKLEATGVPYKSSPDAMTDVIGGRAQFMVTDLASSTALSTVRTQADLRSARDLPPWLGGPA